MAEAGRQKAVETAWEQELRVASITTPEGVAYYTTTHERPFAHPPSSTKRLKNPPPADTESPAEEGVTSPNSYVGKKFPF
ncbi:MAG: hypothetical protein PHU85_06785 [Phycisphaerae bacterium]|nr:hypothetical protein [Phycisphaerae bacterium]